MNPNDRIPNQLLRNSIEVSVFRFQVEALVATVLGLKPETRNLKPPEVFA
jgi:hypothetical protein